MPPWAELSFFLSILSILQPITNSPSRPRRVNAAHLEAIDTGCDP